MPKIGGGGSKGAGGGSYSGAVKIPNLFGKGRSATTIPHETATGQLAMFSPSQIMTSGMKMRGVLRPGPGKRGRIVTSTPPFTTSGSGRPAPRVRVKALARRQELIEKAKASVPKPGEAKKYTPPRQYGPNTRVQQQVDDLFGV